MEFAKDLMAGLRGRLDAGDAGVAPRCDWHGLSARLQAAHAARIALHRLDMSGPGRSGGSFDRAAELLARPSGRGSLAVNPSALGDGKAGSVIDAIADAERLGDGRG